jgi:adenylate cyclase
MMKFPISIKLIIITVALLLGVTVTVAFMASEHFQKTAKQREETINVDFAIAKGTLLQSEMNSYLSRAQSLSSEIFRLISSSTVVQDQAMLEEIVKREDVILGLQILKAEGQIVWKKSFEKEKDLKFSLPEVNQNQIALVSSGSGTVSMEPVRLSDDFSIFRMYSPLVKNDTGDVSHLFVIDYDIKIIHNLFKESTERTYFVVDGSNRVVYHSEGSNYIGMNLEKHEMMVLSRRENAPTKGQKSLWDTIIKEKVYSAFFKTQQDFILVSQISEALILEPAIAVKRRIFLIGGIVLSLSILIVFWFSLTLSSPIERLASLMELVKKGIFDIQASQKTKSLFPDEVYDLALAVDQMAEGLKERDKVKNLFSKFVGSSVTDDLLTREVALGGARKEVVVFFSDIRGFTAMSEAMPPEDVVEMLNEYFGIMVGIINTTGGVVDKFIGDAIMAIWGAPHSLPDDSKRAVMACLKMRQALHALNDKRISLGKEPLMIGMGLNIGPAVAGTIGSDERMEYTVIGNTVNTSSRIEASTKAFGTDLLVSEDIYQRTQEFFIFALAGEVEVKGRSTALKLYKVQGYQDEQGQEVIVSTPYSEYEAESADKVKVKSS